MKTAWLNTIFRYKHPKVFTLVALFTHNRIIWNYLNFKLLKTLYDFLSKNRIAQTVATRVYISNVWSSWLFYLNFTGFVRILEYKIENIGKLIKKKKKVTEKTVLFI